MARFLVSVVAGMLLVVTGWMFWAQSDEIGEAFAAVRDSLTDTSTFPTGPARTGPCPLPEPTTADDMNAMIAQLDEEPTLLGGDHGGSVRLEDGRDLFVFGDTLRSQELGGPFMVRNSMFVTEEGCPLPVVPEEPDEALIPNQGQTGHWPMSLHASPAGGGGTTVQVVTNRVRSLGGFDQFETVGSSLATFEVPEGGTPRLVSTTSLGRDLPDASHPTWGAAMWESDGWLYVFGTASNETKTTGGWSLHVARVRPDALADVGTWEYWDGSTWVQGDPEAARGDGAELVPPDLGVSHVLSVFERDGSWYALSKEGDYLGDTLAVWKAPSVTGPYAKHAIMPLGNEADERRYTPLAHPDIPMGSGRMLVSWSESPTEIEGYLEDPGSYRIRFEEVTLP